VGIFPRSHLIFAKNPNYKQSVTLKMDKSNINSHHISQKENEVSSSSGSSTESEKANLWFMVNNESSSSDSVSDYSTNSESYDQLLIAFKETHDEANRLAIICNKLKSANNILEPKVKLLEKELHKAKTELVSLELTCLHAYVKTSEIVQIWKRRLNTC